MGETVAEIQLSILLITSLPCCFIRYGIKMCTSPSCPRLTIWPGYTTAILHYEHSIMLSIDVSHRVLRSETVLDFMSSLRQQCGNQRFPEICTKELIGLIVLTK